MNQVERWILGQLYANSDDEAWSSLSVDDADPQEDESKHLQDVVDASEVLKQSIPKLRGYLEFVPSGRAGQVRAIDQFGRVIPHATPGRCHR